MAVISYDFWQTRFAGEADVVGREVRLNGHVFTVVGVAPAGFDGPTIGTGRSIYVPMMMQAIMRPPRARYSGDQNPDLLKHLTNSWISVVGRLKSGVSIEQARRPTGKRGVRLRAHAIAGRGGSPAHRAVRAAAADFGAEPGRGP